MMCATSIFYILCIAIMVYAFTIAIAIARMGRMEACIRKFANKYNDRALAFENRGSVGLACATYAELIYCMDGMPGHQFNDYRAMVIRHMDTIERNRGRYYSWR